MTPEETKSSNVWYRLQWSQLVCDPWFLFPALLAALPLRRHVESWWALVGIFGVALGLLALLSIQLRITRFQINRDRIVIKSGLVHRVETVIQYEQLHDVDVLQNFVQKRFKIVTVRLQTSSGSGVTRLRGVEEAVVELLQTSLQTFRNAQAGVEEGHESQRTTNEAEYDVERITLVRMNMVDCVKIAFLRNPVLAVVSTGIAFLFSQGFFRGLIADSVKDFEFDNYVQWTVADGWIPWIDVTLRENTDLVAVGAWVIGVALLFLAVIIAIAIAVSIVIYHRFYLHLQDQTIHVESGLANRISKKTPLKRIQFTRNVSTIRHRLFKSESVYFNTSESPSDGKGDFLASVFGAWLVPVGSPEVARQAVIRALPEVQFDEIRWQAVEWRAWKRRLKKHLFYVIPILVVLLLFSWWTLVFSTLLLAYAVALSRKYVTSVTFAATETAIFVRKGWMQRTSTTIPFSKIQGVTVRQSLFDRQHGMARLLIDVAAYRNKGFAAVIPFMDASKATALANRLIVESTRMYSHEDLAAA